MRTVVLVLIVLSIAYAQNPPVVKTKFGAVQGYLENDNASPYYYYYGIPFAAPPVGDRRFRAPVDPEPWSDVLEAKEFKASCIQTTSAQPGPFSEDCLYLNVVSPPNAKGKLPVLVWIHGGAFLFGGPSSYPAGALSAYTKTIVVTIAYRLDFFGFYFIDDDNSMDENVGLLDQSHAVRWVYDNIEAFGGDPDSITLFGESAGGMSVLLQTILPRSVQTTPLKAIIAESPGPWKLPNTTAQNALSYFLGRDVGCNEDLTACLRKVPAATIIAAIEKTALNFYPVIGGSTVPRQPLAMFNKGDYEKVPIMIGTNEYEGNVFTLYETGRTPEQGIDYDTYLKVIEGFLSKDPQEFLETVLSWYAPYSKARGYWQGAAKAFGDVSLACGAHLASLKIATFQPYTHWRYLFTQVTQGPLAFLNATHTSELPYVFLDPKMANITNFTPSEEQLAYAMTEFWASMPVHGSPIGGRIAWPTWAQSQSVMDFAYPIKMAPLDPYVWSFCNDWADYLASSA